MKARLFPILFVSFLGVFVCGVMVSVAITYPQGCTNHGTTGNNPHTSDSDGDKEADQCHGQAGDNGPCTIAEASYEATVSCWSTFETSVPREACKPEQNVQGAPLAAEAEVLLLPGLEL